MYSYSLKKFVKDWMLVIGMAAGVTLYFLYHELDFLHPAGPFLLASCEKVQPILLFTMLFLTFCKIEPHQLRPHKWMAWLLLFQAASFVAISLLFIFASSGDSAFSLFINKNAIPIEAAMLCLICPTATACAVVTGKLGGNIPGVVTYTILINLLVAVLVPVFVPLIHPQPGLTFGLAFSRILAKVFPLLILPCLSSWLVRYLLPGLHRLLLKYGHWSFYIWAVSLMLAILMSTRAIMNSSRGLELLSGIAIASALTCAIQFWVGKKIGSFYKSRITSGQCLGQKNTVFAIWMGYTFLDPVVSVSGGFYSICHNVFNTWQLYKRRKYLESQNTPMPSIMSKNYVE